MPWNATWAQPWQRKRICCSSSRRLKQELKQDIAETNKRIDLLRKDMEILRSSMTVRLGSIQVVAATLLFAALKLT